ncbi:MAG: class I SAM-dependent methyltransferase [Polyangiales bacterium]
MGVLCRRYNDVFVRFAKIAARLPIPVARPASVVNPSANGHALSKADISRTSGTQKMMSPLGVQWGIDPSPAMQSYAARRGISVSSGTAEEPPFEDESFDAVLAVTTICFVDDARRMVAEARRVLRPNGQLVIGFIERAGELGGQYLHKQLDNVFYREATFYSAMEVQMLLAETGFERPVWVQTLSRPLDEIVEIEPIKSGHGQSGPSPPTKHVNRTTLVLGLRCLLTSGTRCDVPIRTKFSAAKATRGMMLRSNVDFFGKSVKLPTSAMALVSMPTRTIHVSVVFSRSGPRANAAFRGPVTDPRKFGKVRTSFSLEVILETGRG